MDPQQEALLHKAGEWFLESGIQRPGGGVARYYRGDEQRYLAVSNEITGYAASTYAYLYRRTRRTRYKEAAIATARYLTGTAWDAELATFPFEAAAGSPAYFFDCGIIVRGLLAVWDIDPIHELRELASFAAHSMASDFVEGGTIHPIIELPSKTPRPHERRWSLEPGCFQLKSALAWRALGDPRLDVFWNNAVRSAMASDACFLPGNLHEDQVMDRLHAYCYYLEGMLGAPDATLVLAAGIERTAGYLRAIRRRFVRSDVCAQLLRLRLYASALGVPLNHGQAAEEAAWVEGFALRSEDPALDGAYSFGRRQGELLPMANPVSTGFCLQSLDCWLLHQQGSFQPNLASLI